MVTNIIVTIIGLGVLTLIGFGIYKVVCFILDIVGDVKTKRNDKKRKQIEKEQQDLKRIETFNNLKLQCETIPDTCKQSNLHDIPKYKKE
jgi:hypothetical protein